MNEKQSKDQGKATMTVAQIMERYDKSSVYVKRALQRGWLPGHKQMMSGTKVEQWVAYVEDVEAWRKSAESRKSPKARFAGTARQLADFKAWCTDPTTKASDIEAVRKSLEAMKQ